MSHPILNVAVIGVGEVAMTTHLPTLLLCSDLYRTVALVDISQNALDHCSKKFHVDKTFTDVGEMLSGCPEVDVVMIMNANEYHVPHAVQCLEAGKHVFIEKPMAVSISGADQIEAARVKSGKVVFVGYMRRYAPAFLKVRDLVQKAREGGTGIDYVRVRDIIGMNEFFVNESGTFVKRFSDFPPEAGKERKQLSDAINEEALGTKATNSKDTLTWMLLNGLSSHDISAMREIVGMPKGVLSAVRSPSGLFIWVTFLYDGFVAYYECGIDRVRKFDAHIEVYAGDQRFKVEYQTPYIKGLPITATVLSTTEDGEFSEQHLRPTYEDPYTSEYKRLHAAIVAGEEVKTSPLDAKADLEIFKMIMDAMRDI